MNSAHNLSQIELEKWMYRGGLERGQAIFDQAHSSGRADTLPPAKSVVRDFLPGLSEALKQQVSSALAGEPGPGVYAAVILKDMDSDAVILLALRSVINTLLQKENATLTELSYSLGYTIHRELALSHLAEEMPELFFIISQDLARRRSSQEAHRYHTLKASAVARGFSVPEWPPGHIPKVGMFLVQLLEASGLLVIAPQSRRGVRLAPRPVRLSDDVVTRIASIKDYLVESSPFYGPCVERPLEWTGFFGGGFHTAHMRAISGGAVRVSGAVRDKYRSHKMPTFYAALNALQNTEWAVNTRILDVVQSLPSSVSTKEMGGTADLIKPHRPDFMQEQADLSGASDENKALFKDWKKASREYYEERKRVVSKLSRFRTVVDSANMFKDCPKIHFVYFADSRGRLYPMTTGLNPQGSDLQKAVLHAAVGKPIDSEHARLWFYVHGANKFGYDKASLEDRAAWVTEHIDQIMLFAKDPVSNLGWTEADKPLQFLAWCFEFYDYITDKPGFVNRIPISMDGSANGLQNLSMLFKDEVGGLATNLVPGPQMQDIYAQVAAATEERLRGMLPSDDTGLVARWLHHGVARKAVKRTCMTLPYGVTRRSATEYVVKDYLETVDLFEATEHRDAAIVLMAAMWPALGDVVVKGQEAIAWLKQVGRKLMADGHSTLQWNTPSGFLATQAYAGYVEKRVFTYLHGKMRIRMRTEADVADKRSHVAGLAPNFVHSMDASHLQRVCARAAADGIGFLAMIHDDFGTLAADSGRLYEIIRDEFVNMYTEQDPISNFVAAYPGIPEPPKSGSLDIEQVRDSVYFFS